MARAPGSLLRRVKPSTRGFEPEFRRAVQRLENAHHRDRLPRQRPPGRRPSGGTGSESEPRDLPVHGHYVHASTGVGKTWLACALAQQAARAGFSVLYLRAPRLLEELRIAHGDGSFSRRLAQLARIDLLALDDFAIAPITAPERNDLLELLDDRVGAKATLITSQLPVKSWHEWLADPTLADAILDRIVHRSHRIALKGGSLRKDPSES